MSLFGDHTFKQELYETIERLREEYGMSWRQVATAIVEVLTWILTYDVEG